MELLVFLLLIVFFFAFFGISRDSQGNLKLERKKVIASPSLSLSKFVKSKYLNGLLTLGFVAIELFLFVSLLSPVETLIKVRASQLIPEKFTPIARFAANMDWDSKKINLDASMSKAYQDKVTNFIWRIDDGTSLVGSKTLEHQFIHPGYYLVQLSVVDADDQSDVATCQILIPPQELEKVPTHERLAQSKDNGEKIQDVDYDWAPKGTFFNYSKMGMDDRSYANLKSHYIESGCGYSNKSYNTSSNSYIDFLHDSRVQRAFVELLRVVIAGIVIVPIVFTVLKVFLRRAQAQG